MKDNNLIHDIMNNQTTAPTKKKKLLCYSDSAQCATGFAQVARNILMGVQNLGKYDVIQLGINYWGDPHEYPFPIYPMGINKQNDPYGREKAKQMIIGLDWEILFLLQDTFILQFLRELVPELRRQGRKGKIVVYAPADGTPKPEWVEGISHADACIAYTQWAKEKWIEAYPPIESKIVDIIPHGINTSHFFPLKEEERQRFRAGYFGKVAGNFIFCFPKGQLVSTEHGYKDISNIEVGNYVLTHEKRFKPVTKKFKRVYSGEIIKLKLTGTDEVKGTPEHPVLFAKRSDVLCKYEGNSRANYVCRPKEENVEYSRPCSTCGYYDDFVLTLENFKFRPFKDIEKGDFVLTPVDNFDCNIDELWVENISYSKLSKQLSDKVKLTENVMKMFGLWLAEGSYIKRGDKYYGIVINIRSSDKESINVFKKGLKEGFNLDCGEYTYPDRKIEFPNGKEYISNMTAVVCSSINLSSMFLKWFGEYSDKKYIDNIFDKVCPELQMALCLGYITGDGCFRKNNHSNSFDMRIVSTSILLLKSVRKMLLRNGVISSMYNGKKHFGFKDIYILVAQGNGLSKILDRFEKDDISTKKVRSRFILDGYLVSEVRDVSTEIFDGSVYNIEVSEDNSYVVNDVAVHNCNINRNQQRKDIPRTLMAFKKVLKARSNISLYLHMSPKDLGWDLAEVVKTLGLDLSTDVVFPANFNVNQGFPLDVLNKVYNSVDCVLSTTYGEGWGLSWLESMAVNKPVIFPDNTAMTENLAEGRGLLVKSGEDWDHHTIICNDFEVVRPVTNLDDLIEKMIYCIDNPEEMKKMSDKAHKWVLENLKWDYLIPRFIKVFDDVLKIEDKEEQEVDVL